MRLSPKARMNRMFTNGRCLDVALDHGVCNEPGFLIGLENMPGVVDTPIKAKPDATQMAFMVRLICCKHALKRISRRLLCVSTWGTPIMQSVTGSCDRCCKTLMRQFSAH